MDVERIITQVRTNATANDHYSGCAQAVLGALQESLGIGNTESFKAATVLSGGVARRGETCGALVGALMGLGLVCGRNDMKDTAAYSRANDEAQSLVDDFKASIETEFGLGQPLTSTLCRDIQARVLGRSYYLANADERAAFLENGGHEPAKCPRVCAIAAGVAARKILSFRQPSRAERSWPA